MNPVRLLRVASMACVFTSFLLAGQQEILNYEQLPLSLHSVRVEQAAAPGAMRLVGVAQNNTKATVRFVTVKLLHFTAGGTISGSQMYSVPLTVEAGGSSELSLEISKAVMQRSSFTAIGLLAVASESNEWVVTDAAFEKKARQRLGVPTKP